jgi:hypothetical protein
MVPGAAPQNLGVLTLDQNLSGVLETLTPLHSFDLMITPEMTGTVLEPSRAPVLSARLVLA